MEIRDLSPKALWNNFADLNEVPRPSKHEEHVIRFMVNYGNKLGLETITDSIGNVIIKKPATPGMENRRTVVLQAHLDMVHQKNNDTVFDFNTQGIEMYAEGDWVKARGTTLGADNGIGVAAAMTILAATDIPHPPLEALFTVDEETGMTGATRLDPANISGRILLNLDTEDDTELSIGCAGGLDTNTSYTYQQTAIGDGYACFTLKIKGLQGGHSGMDIHKGRANANKLMNRLLYKALQKTDLKLVSFDGGGLRNAIPREATSVIVLPKEQQKDLLPFLEEFTATVKTEYRSIEKTFTVEWEKIEVPQQAMDDADLKKIVNSLYALPNGVYRMSPDIADFVEVSSNLARVIIKDGSFVTQSLQRSGVESTKDDIANAVRAGFENTGCKVEQTGDYPGWKPNPGSAILHLMQKLYKNYFGHEPEVKACHAGLECGILGGHLPGLDMISFGPNITGAHSPDEKVQISSVQKFYGYLLEALKGVES